MMFVSRGWASENRSYKKGLVLLLRPFKFDSQFVETAYVLQLPPQAFHVALHAVLPFRSAVLKDAVCREDFLLQIFAVLTSGASKRTWRQSQHSSVFPANDKVIFAVDIMDMTEVWTLFDWSSHLYPELIPLRHLIRFNRCMLQEMLSFQRWFSVERFDVPWWWKCW